MNKNVFLNTVIITYLIINIKSLCTGEKKKEGEECQKLKIDPLETNEYSTSHCCLFKGKSETKEEYNICIILKENEYKNIKQYISLLTNKGVEVNNIECSSKYIKNSLILYILLIIFILFI